MDHKKKLSELLYEAMLIEGSGRDLCEKIAQHLIANGVTAQEWISVTERLPEDDERLEFYDDGRLRGTTVLAYTEYGRTVPKNRLIIRPTGDEYFDQFVTDGWEWSKGTENVTHWMPLPRPPKERGAKENENQVI